MKSRDSGLRDAFVGLLMTVGPFFGVRYKPPRVEIPVVTTPAMEDDQPARWGRDARPDQEQPADGEDGITL